jgi:hypothetical protein
MENDVGGTYNTHVGWGGMGVINLYENGGNLKGKRQRLKNRRKIGG